MAGFVLSEKAADPVQTQNRKFRKRPGAGEAPFGPFKSPTRSKGQPASEARPRCFFKWSAGVLREGPACQAAERGPFLRPVPLAAPVLSVDFPRE